MKGGIIQHGKKESCKEEGCKEEGSQEEGSQEEGRKEALRQALALKGGASRPLFYWFPLP